MQGSWKIQLRQKLRNLRRPESSGTKQKRDEQDENQDPAESGIRRQPKKSKHPTFEVTEEESYEGKVLELQEDEVQQAQGCIADEGHLPRGESGLAWTCLHLKK